MIPACRLSAAARLLVTAGAALAFLFAAADARAQTSPTACEESAEVAVLPAPIGPWTGAPLRVVFAAEHSFQGELSLIAPDGTVAAKSRERFDGPPYSWFVEVASPAAGKWRASLTRDGATGECATITREITVANKKPPGPGNGSSMIWPVRNNWTRATENISCST